MQLSSKLLFALLFSLVQVNKVKASFTAIVGYEPDTSVEDRAKIDLDQRAIENELSSSPPAYSNAKNQYENGQYSIKSDGSNRTIQDLSVNDCKILKRGLPQFEIYNDYWVAKGFTPCNFGDELVTAALDGIAAGTSGFTFHPSDDVTGSDDFRVQAIKKSTVYDIIMMYTMYEIQDAFSDCTDGDFTNNTGSVKAIDEAAAFHAGSLEGTVKGGVDGLMTTSGNVGKLMYALAEKRCENFGTCTADGSINDSPIEGYSAVNDNIMSRLIDLQSQMALANGGTMTGWSCSDIEPVRDAIFSQMLVPLIQGTLRYLWKTDTAFGTASNKELGELWAFSTAILPMLDSVNPTAANALYNRAWGLDRDTHNFASMKSMMEQSYSALGVSCADVNQLCDTSVTGSDCVPYSTPYSTAACSDSSASSGQSNDDIRKKNEMIGGLVAMAVIIFVFFGGAIVYLYRQNATKHQRLIEFESGTGIGMHMSDNNHAMTERYGGTSSV